ncbi:hypothetical protein DSM112329_00293 [Paraconexibacter sp. AEG42_29]|uniref:Uncharacterized protein n=1 Tax=Paraconexibacter sp. AEG42_29 TaxID=2997339 RepID=A0AAU7APC9_9ACTN
MIRRPSTPLLLSLSRGSLATVPDLPAGEQRETLALVDGILGICERRAEHEQAWMLEEIHGIEELVTHLVMCGGDADGALRSRYAGLVPAGDLAPAQIPERYDVCSAMLSEAIPVALGADADTRSMLDAVLDVRIAHEREIRGDVKLVRD